MPPYFLLVCLTLTAMISMAELSMARQTYFHPDKTLSSLRIEGRSNVNEFECISQNYSGSASVYSRDRKSTRLNSSHVAISYAVFCLKKKKKNHTMENANRS